MGTTKSEIFSKKQNELAWLMKVLGHPARIAIIQQLVKTKGCICGDLVEKSGLAQSTISQHLKELKSIGLIKGRIEGNRTCYCLDAKKWKQYRKMAEAFFAVYESKNCC